MVALFFTSHLRRARHERPPSLREMQPTAHEMNSLHLAPAAIIEAGKEEVPGKMEEIRIAICEDEEQVMDLLVQSLKMSFSAQGVTAHFERYAQGADLLEKIEEESGRYDVYFLDIEMPGMNGIELCRRARAIIPEALVVFISNKEELVFQSLEVQPFRFVRKSHFVEEQERTVRAIVRELGRHHERYVHLEDTRLGRSIRVDVNALSLVEVRGRDCHFTVGGEELTIRCRLQDVEELLEGHDFLKPHRSYLVNANAIRSVGRAEVTLTDGTEVPLSRNRANEVRGQFMNIVREEL